MKQKEKREMLVFEEFASTAGLSIDPGTTEPRMPPEPDIRCRISGQGRAFELTEIVDPVRKRSRAIMLKSLQGIQKRVEDLPLDHPFIEKFSDAGFQVTFRDDATESACRKAGAELIDHLAQDQTVLNIAGREYVRLPENKLLNAIQYVHITRDYPGGPVISASSGGAVTIPIIDAIAAKFAKIYSTDVDIDLIAYFDTYRALGEETWRPRLKELIESEKINSQFERVWIFDRRGKRLIYPSKSYDST